MPPPLLDAGDVWVAWARVGAGGLGGAQDVRVARNPSERGVWHGAGAGHGEQRPYVALEPDDRVLACPISFLFILPLHKCYLLSSSLKFSPSLRLHVINH